MTVTFSFFRNLSVLALLAGPAAACGPIVTGDPGDDGMDPTAAGGSSGVGDGDGDGDSGGTTGDGDGDGGNASDDPCEGKACGDACSECVKGRLCPLIALSCDADGVCGGGKACEEPGVPAGELCSDSEDCEKDEYCEFEDSQGCDDGALGRCAARPEACDLLYDPVCGCDGITYGNACAAAMAGAQVGSSGACEK